MSLLSSSDVETVVLIVCDSLRADVCADEMPFVTQLGNDCTTATNYFTPGASTPSSMPAIMQSRSPLDHRGYGLTLPPDQSTIAEALSQSGVRCRGWHSNTYTSRQYGFDRGFDELVDVANSATSGSDSTAGEEAASWRDRAKAVTNSLGVRSLAERAFEQVKRYGFADANPKVRAEQPIDACLDWLPNRPDDQDRFAWLHLMDTHLPYYPPREYRKRIDDAPIRSKRVYDLWKQLIHDPQSLNEADIERLRSLYAAEARYVDDQIRRFVTALKQRGLWEETALVFTADHGELFGDRPVPNEPSLKHPDYLCEELTHVPLVIGGPAVSDRTVESLVSGLDLAPTVSRLLNVDPPTEWVGVGIETDDFEQRDHVVSALAHEYGAGEGARVSRRAIHVAIRSDEYTVLWWRDDSIETRFYRRTPDGEVRLESGDITDRLRENEQLAKDHAELYVDVTETGDRGGDVTERLRDLGYVD